MTKKIDVDILALKRAKEALLKSTSPRMMRANLEYLCDYFILHPPKELNKHWLKRAAPRLEGKDTE